jgi:aerobic-type carbon monoxide dehydrogenase small subunit (CoxS/CutS family)
VTEKGQISFTLIFNGQQYRVATTPTQYYSLMSLIVDTLTLSGFGLCSGMGGCGTCMVRINGRNVLSCEVAVNESLVEAVIEVIEV